MVVVALDDLPLRRAVVDVLGREGWCVHGGDEGHAGTAGLVIVSDVGAAHRLRSAGVLAPVLVVTGSADASLWTRAAGLHDVAVVVMPLDLDLLRAIVADLLTAGPPSGGRAPRRGASCPS